MQARILAAVDAAVNAIGDLAIPAIHTARVQVPFTPGSSVTYQVTNYKVRVVLGAYTEKEIEQDRDLASDVKIMVFDEKVPPQPNDTLTVNGVQYRVMRRNPTHAGSEVAFSTVQARPLGA